MAFLLMPRSQLDWILKVLEENKTTYIRWVVCVIEKALKKLELSLHLSSKRRDCKEDTELANHFLIGLRAYAFR